MADSKLPPRALMAATCFALLASTGLALLGSPTWALGFALGAALGLTSLASFTYAIPRLFKPGNPAARLLFGMIAILKLPLYAIVLYFAMVSPAVQPFAVFLGVALVPTALVVLALLPQVGRRASRVSARPMA